MIRLKLNEDRYRYGVGQLCTGNGICILNTMYYTYYSVNCGFQQKLIREVR